MSRTTEIAAALDGLESGHYGYQVTEMMRDMKWLLGEVACLQAVLERIGRVNDHPGRIAREALTTDKSEDANG